MASTIRIKRSSVAGKIPNTSNISTGELGLNLADKRLFSSNGSTTFELGSNPHSLSVGSGSFTIANGAITFPSTNGVSGQILQVNSNGVLSFVDNSAGGGIALTDLSVSTSTASGNGALSYDSSTGVFSFTPADTDLTNFVPRKLDSISTVNGTATYSMLISGTGHSPTNVNTLIVSRNGVIQEPGTDFTISGSNITFIPGLQTNDVIDFIIDFGRAATTQAVTGTFSPKKLDAITTDGSTNYSLKSANVLYSVSGHQNSLLVSLNGVIQEPGNAFNVTGASNNIISFASALTANDNIDFILDYNTNGTFYIEQYTPAFNSVQFNNNMVLGSSNSAILTVNAKINSNLIPYSNNTYTVGNSNLRWKNIYLGTSVDINGASITSSGSTINLPASSTVGGATIGTVDDATALAIALG